MTTSALVPSRYCPRCGLDTAETVCPQDGTPTFVRKHDALEPVAFRIGDVIGRYRITGVVGAGGFGAVFSAEHLVTGQAAAVKVMTGDGGELPPDAVQRFLQEARVTASLTHPNTVRIYDFGQSESGVLFMAMELLHGRTLEEHIAAADARGAAMSEHEAATIGIQVLRSLTQAHAAGLVHRDLKPANIMLAELTGEPSIVKVLDFGIARTQNSELTQAGTALGTPLYMSPEQARGEVPDGRSDVYALGCILYACVSGRPPFEDPNPMTILLNHQCEALPDLRQRARVPLSAAFIDVVAGATTKKREDRFANAQAMREALEAVLVPARPVVPVAEPVAVVPESPRQVVVLPPAPRAPAAEVPPPPAATGTDLDATREADVVQAASLLAARPSAPTAMPVPAQPSPRPAGRKAQASSADTIPPESTSQTRARPAVPAVATRDAAPLASSTGRPVRRGPERAAPRPSFVTAQMVYPENATVVAMMPIMPLAEAPAPAPAAAPAVPPARGAARIAAILLAAVAVILAAAWFALREPDAASSAASVVAAPVAIPAAEPSNTQALPPPVPAAPVAVAPAQPPVAPPAPVAVAPVAIDVPAPPSLDVAPEPPTPPAAAAPAPRKAPRSVAPGASPTRPPARPARKPIAPGPKEKGFELLP